MYMCVCMCVCVRVCTHAYMYTYDQTDGYYGFEEEEWPKVLPFLVSCYQLESGKNKNRRDGKVNM